MSAKPVLAVTMGDPGGIGPEIVVKALADPAIAALARFIILGLDPSLSQAAETAGIKPFWDTPPRGGRLDGPCTLINYQGCDAIPAWPDHWSRGPDPAAGCISRVFVEDAVEHCKAGRAHGIVTAPICKDSWYLGDIHGPLDHTSLISMRLGVQNSRMMFHSPKLIVVLQTIHVPLRSVASCIRFPEDVLATIELAHEAGRRLGIEKPRIAVCGLNPHAGERGLIGDEEEKVIAPAIEQAKEKGIAVTGPHPGDTIFIAALRGDHDIVIAMYHDQGLIPVKLLYRDEAVNVTIGIPTVRTSPDHGTAFDIAGRNKADPGSMKAAIRLAARMAAGQ